MPTLDNFSLGNYGLGGFDKDAPVELMSSGSVTSSTGTGPYVYRFDTQVQNGTSYFAYVVTMFAKIPKFILFKRGGITEGIYVRDIKNVNGSSLVTVSQAYCAVITSDWYVNTTGFKLPVLVANGVYTWEAYA